MRVHVLGCVEWYEIIRQHLQASIQKFRMTIFHQLFHFKVVLFEFEHLKKYAIEDVREQTGCCLLAPKWFEIESNRVQRCNATATKWSREKDDRFAAVSCHHLNSIDSSNRLFAHQTSSSSSSCYCCCRYRSISLENVKKRNHFKQTENHVLFEKRTKIIIQGWTLVGSIIIVIIIILQRCEKVFSQTG